MSGWLHRSLSIPWGATFWPAAVMMRSFLRPTTRRYPSGSSGAGVPAVHPAVGVEQLGGGRRVLEVALTDVAPLDQDLAVVAEPDRHARQGGAHGADAVPGGPVGGGRPASLGLAVELDDGESDGVEPADEARVDRRRRADQDVGLVQAQALADGGAQRPVEGEVLEAARRRERWTPLFGVHLPQAQRDVVVGRHPYREREGADVVLDAVAQLLPDSGDGEEDRGPAGGQVLGDRRQAAGEPCLAGHGDGQEEAHHPLGDMAERQEGEQSLPLADGEAAAWRS